MACCPTCVSWVLLASYAVLLGVGGVGMWVSVNNFWGVERLPPTPPPQLEVTTTTTPDPYGNQYHYHSSYDNVPDTYKEYLDASMYFAKATSDARMYVMLPCVVSMMVASLVLMAGLWSRQFFSSTFSLYNSVGLWVLTLTWTIVYQTVVAWDSRMDVDSVLWVVVIHTVLMLVLSVQILLCVWELRRQEAGWPTINFRNVFTIEALVVTVRLTVTVFTIKSLADSGMIRGYRGQKDPRYEMLHEYPGIRYPMVLILVCVSAACYNAVATVETTLSMLLGKLHICMTTTSTLLSGLCCATVAVLNSPVIVRQFISPNIIYPDTMYFSIGLSVVTFLHLVICLAFPTTSRAPPQILYKIINAGISAINSLGSDMTREQLWYPVLPQKTEKINFIFNVISSVFSIISIIVVAAVWDSPLYRSWGSIMVLCVNFAMLVRTLPLVVMQLRFKQAENTPVNQKLMSMALENAILIVGAIAMCARCYYGAEIFAGVANLLFFAFQIFIMVQLVQGKFRATESKDAEHLTETMEAASQDEEDVQTTSDILA